jgi:hypothetical protein
MFTAIRPLPRLLCVFMFFLAASAAAQSVTGSIQGTVQDSQGAAVPGVTVNLRNVDTDVSRLAVTDGAGFYRFLNVPVGNYEITAELSGFSRYLRSGFTLAINQVAVVDAELRPAAVTETVEVRADAPLINTTNAEVGVRFDTRRVAELPVMGSRSSPWRGRPRGSARSRAASPVLRRGPPKRTTRRTARGCARTTS